MFGITKQAPPHVNAFDGGAKPIASRNTAGTSFNKTGSQAADGVPNAVVKQSPDENPNAPRGKRPRK